MLEFKDLPYRFVPPKPNPFLISLTQWVMGKVALPSKRHLIEELEIRGQDTFRQSCGKDAHTLLLPNHSTHSDPQVMSEVTRRLGIQPSFMAAYDVFARSRIQSWIMQRSGAFSVDREGSDRKSMKCATDVLIEGKHPLILFPEGNVYFCNDEVAPFAEGASYIALSAQKKLGESHPVYAVPVSMKFTYIEDIRDQLRSSLDELARRFETELDPEADFGLELLRISTTALQRFLRQRGYSSSKQASSVDEQIHNAAEQIINSLEEKIEIQSKTGSSLTDRIRRVRATIHGIRIDPDREVDHPAAALWADEAILAVRVLGYQGGYMATKPTLDRVAETVARLREDVHSLTFPPAGKRRCIVQLGNPIDLRERLEPFRSKARQTIADLTRDCEAAVQSGIDDINASNDALGAQLF
jgi:1-acyl-sn-glycerol-3-phosphate acyltransferase